jgi:DNA-directed RNA polymerase specialized sigma24 family protein
MTAHASWSDLLAGLLAGSADAAAELVARLGRLVELVVRHHLPRWARRVVDVEHVAQEVWFSFLAEKSYLRLRGGPRCLPGFVCGLARHKAQDALRDCRAQKRGGHRVLPLQDCSAEDLLRLQEPHPGPADTATGRDLWQSLFATEQGTVLSIIELRVCGLHLDEIAGALELSVSSIKRVLVALRRRWLALAR